MALKLFQREIDELLSVITNSSKFRRMVDKRTHICTFNVNQLAGQLKAQTKRTNLTMILERVKENMQDKVNKEVTLLNLKDKNES